MNSAKTDLEGFHREHKTIGGLIALLEKRRNIDA